MEKFLKCLKKYEPLLRCITDFIIVTQKKKWPRSIRMTDILNSAMTNKVLDKLFESFILYHCGSSVDIRLLTEEQSIEAFDKSVAKARVDFIERVRDIKEYDSSVQDIHPNY